MKYELCNYYNHTHYPDRFPCLFGKPLSPGTRIIIRTDLVDGQAYGTDTFISNMRKYCGKETRIRSHREYPRGIAYDIDIDGGYWYWSEKMFRVLD